MKNTYLVIKSFKCNIYTFNISRRDKASLELWKQRGSYKEANRIKTEAYPEARLTIHILKII